MIVLLIRLLLNNYVQQYNWWYILRSNGGPQVKNQRSRQSLSLYLGRGLDSDDLEWIPISITFVPSNLGHDQARGGDLAGCDHSVCCEDFARQRHDDSSRIDCTLLQVLLAEVPSAKWKGLLRAMDYLPPRDLTRQCIPPDA